MRSSNWMNWCRLCARVDGVHELTETVADILQTHFQISISNKDDSLSVVCQDCLDIVLNVEQLILNYWRVSKMFLKLARNNTEIVNIRHKYDLFESTEATNGDNSLSYVNYLKIEKAESYSQSETDELDSSNVNNETVYIDGYNLCCYDENMDYKEAGKDEQQILDGLVDEQQLLDNEVDESICQRDEDENVSLDEELNPVNEECLDDKLQLFDHEIVSHDHEDDESCFFQRDGEENEELHPVNEDLNNQNVQTSLRRPKTLLAKEKSVPNFENENNLKFVCPTCLKSFTSKTNLLKHENIHLPDNSEKSMPCPYCKTMFRKRYLTEHVKFVHSSVRPYVCEECGKAFVQKAHLVQHSVTHTTDRPFSCPKCPKSFKNASHLQKHMDVHNEDIHECPECGRKLSTKRNLRTHMIVHSSIRRHSCHLCERRFKRLYTLKKHLDWHTGNRPFTCPFCGKTFTHDYRLNYHVKQYHSKEVTLRAISEHTQLSNSIN